MYMKQCIQFRDYCTNCCVTGLKYLLKSRNQVHTMHFWCRPTHSCSIQLGCLVVVIYTSWQLKLGSVFQAKLWILLWAFQKLNYSTVPIDVDSIQILLSGPTFVFTHDCDRLNLHSTSTESFSELHVLSLQWFNTECESVYLADIFSLCNMPQAVREITLTHIDPPFQLFC